MSMTANKTDKAAFAVDFDAVSLKRTGQPEEVASLVAFLLGDESKYISGGTHSIDGGWYC
jgi:NAD(P)-dependent dehydrogenase (short-subunit alcohol dehydrogenase family)